MKEEIIQRALRPEEQEFLFGVFPHICQTKAFLWQRSHGSVRIPAWVGVGETRLGGYSDFKAISSRLELDGGIYEIRLRRIALILEQSGHLRETKHCYQFSIKDSSQPEKCGLLTSVIRSDDEKDKVYQQLSSLFKGLLLIADDIK